MAAAKAARACSNGGSQASATSSSGAQAPLPEPAGTAVGRIAVIVGCGFWTSKPTAVESAVAPLLATTLIPPDETEPLNDAHEIRERFEHDLAGVVDAGACALAPTTVIDLTPMGSGDDPEVLREGAGLLSALGL